MNTMWLVSVLAVVGVGWVLPVALRSPWRPWAVVASFAAVSYLLAPGPVSAAFALPALGLSVGATGRRALDAWVRPLDLGRCADVVVAAFAVVATASLVQSRAGISIAGIGEPLVELTAVHFTYAGAGSLALALRTASGASTPGRRRLGALAVAAVALGPFLVATGFAAGLPALLVAGAMVMTIGILATAVGELAEARALTDGPLGRRALLAVSGLAAWAPMAMALAWALAQAADVPHLGIDAMVPLHGAPNAVLFVGAGLLAHPRRAHATTLSVWRPTAAHLRHLLEEARLEPLPPDVASLVAGAAMPGTRRTTAEQAVPRASEPTTIGAALEGWRAHTGTGAIVLADGPARIGTTVVLAVPLPVGWAVGACRVVAHEVGTEDRRVTYATLGHHPERGVETFWVRRDAGGGVVVGVDATWRLHHPLARALPGVASAVQHHATLRYVDAMVRLATAPTVEGHPAAA